MVIFQPAMLVYQRVFEIHSFTWSDAAGSQDTPSWEVLDVILSEPVEGLKKIS